MVNLTEKTVDNHENEMSLQPINLCVHRGICCPFLDIAVAVYSQISCNSINRQIKEVKLVI